MSPSSAPRVYPWTLLGLAAGALTAAAIGIAVWTTAGDADVDRSTAGVLAVTLTPVLLGTVVGLGVGLFIRVAGIVRAWQPPRPTTIGGVPVASTNGHGASDGRRSGRADGALFAIVALLGALLTVAPPTVPMVPAPMVLAVGSLALDERAWVRMVAAIAVFVAAFSLVGFLVTTAVQGGAAIAALLAGVVVVGAATFAAVRRVHPRTLPSSAGGP